MKNRYNKKTNKLETLVIIMFILAGFMTFSYGAIKGIQKFVKKYNESHYKTTLHNTINRVR